LATLLSDILGLEISEGALVNMLDAARDAFAAQRSAICARLLSGTALQSDETGLRVGFITATAPSFSPSLRGARRRAAQAEADV
jgi:hypothetical protein